MLNCLTQTETTATATDLTIPINRPQGTGVLGVLILTTAEATKEREAEPKIKSFMSAIRPANSLKLILLVNDASQDSGLQGLMALQMLLFEFGHPPLLMASATKVLPLLEKHIQQLKQPLQPTSHPTVLPTNLIAHATSTAPSRPLSEHDANVLTDLFSSIKEVEAGTRTATGQGIIHDWLDAKTAKGVIEFWADEWLV